MTIKPLGWVRKLKTLAVYHSHALHVLLSVHNCNCRRCERRHAMRLARKRALY